MSLENIQKTHEAVQKGTGARIVGKEKIATLLTVALLCEGHMLIDDVPGTGKTVLSKAFASSLSLDFKRVQCVPDMLPGDLVGVNFYDTKLSEFRFVKGPVFTNILLADEINRAMPKTQSGLLECMEEHQVTVDGVTYKLDEPFMVIATQNPVETKGTFDLPEAQLDRFLLKTSMGYPTHEESVEILSRKLTEGKEGIPQTEKVDRETLLAARAELKQVYVHRDLLSYAASICEATRKSKDVILGAGPRAMIALVKVARGFAAIKGRDYVLPDDIKEAAIPTLAHRLVFQNDFFHRGNLGEELLVGLLEKLPVPSEQIDFAKRG